MYITLFRKFFQSPITFKDCPKLALYSQMITISIMKFGFNLMKGLGELEFLKILHP